MKRILKLIRRALGLPTRRSPNPFKRKGGYIFRTRWHRTANGVHAALEDSPALPNETIYRCRDGETVSPETFCDS